MTRLKKLILTLLLPAVGWAAFPSSFTYQGSLKQNGALVNGTYPMEFRLTNFDGTQTYWTSGVQNITVQEGLYRVELTPANVNWGNTEPYIQVSVNGNVLLPREKMNSAPYALIAKELAPNALAQGDVSVMGRLSIGATPPSYKFQVSDYSPAANQDEMMIEAETSPVGNWAQTKFGFRNGWPSIQSRLSATGPSTLSLNPDGGNVGIGLTDPRAALTIYRHGLTGSGVLNNLLGAGYATQAMDGNRQFWIQQWLTSNTARTFLVGNGYISATNAPVANHGPYTKFQAIEFNDTRFGFVTGNSGNIFMALSVNPNNGYVGVGTGDQTSQLEVAGDVRVHGAVRNEQNKPAFLVSVFMDDCNEGHPYMGCPNGYIPAGRWHVGRYSAPVCDGLSRGQGYENGSIQSGWMAMCVAQ